MALLPDILAPQLIPLSIKNDVPVGIITLDACNESVAEFTDDGEMPACLNSTAL
jgi:hypothetical protein